MYPIWSIFLLVILATLITYLDNAAYHLTIQTERDKHQIQYAINAASDAAIDQLLDTTKTASSNSVIIDPDYIWKVYKYTFLRSNNLYSVEMMNTLEASFPSVVIAVNDGFYMRMLVDTQRDNGTVREYRFSQKIPYARTTLVDTPISDGPPDVTYIPKGMVVSDTMDGNNIWVHKLQSGLDYSVVQTATSALESVTGSAHDVVDINRMLLNAIEYTMFFNSSHSATDSVDAARLSIPDQVTSSLLSPSVNFVGPTIFAFSDNFNLRGKTYSNYYSVGASQIVKASKYYAYRRGGYKYYSRLEPRRITGASQAEEIFTTPQQAAQAGYRPDPLFY